MLNEWHMDVFRKTFKQLTFKQLKEVRIVKIIEQIASSQQQKQTYLAYPAFIMPKEV